MQRSHLVTFFFWATACLSFTPAFALDIAPLSYELDTTNETATVLGFSGASQTDLSIPSTIKSGGVLYDVTTIKDSAFFLDATITSLTLPTTLTEIGDLAFEGHSITELTLPASLTVLGPFAFGSGMSLTSVTFQGDYSSTLDFTAFSSSLDLTSITACDSATGWSGRSFDISANTLAVTQSSSACPEPPLGEEAEFARAETQLGRGEVRIRRRDDDGTPMDITTVGADLFSIDRSRAFLVRETTAFNQAAGSDVLSVVETVDGPKIQGIAADGRSFFAREVVFQKTQSGDLVAVYAAKFIDDDPRDFRLQFTLLTGFSLGSPGLYAAVAGLGTNSPGRFLMLSDPVELASFTTDSDGVARSKLETTESVSPGNHTLLIATDDLLVSLGIELVDDTSNAAVPVPTLALTALMVLSVLLGLMGLVQVRARRMRFNTTS